MNELSKVSIDNITAESMDREELVTYPLEAFLSKEYLEVEKRLLWPHIWRRRVRK